MEIKNEVSVVDIGEFNRNKVLHCYCNLKVESVFIYFCYSKSNVTFSS